MLNEELIDKVVERLARRIEQGNEYVLQEIGKSVKKIGTLSPSKAQELAQILKYGGDYDKIVKRLAEITELNVKDIYKIFKEVAKNDYNFAERFYKYRNIKYIPFEQNEALQEQIKALAEITAREYVNIAKTTAFARMRDGHIAYTDLSTTYQNILDEAILNVGQGKETFDSAMKRSLKQLGQSGLRAVDYTSGKSRRMDSAVRMNLKAGLTHMHDEMQQQLGKEFDADGVEISVHENPAPDHENAQGKQFTNEEYAKLQRYGVATAQGNDKINLHRHLVRANASSMSFRPIGEYNCYHYIFSIVIGVSEPNYTRDQLDDIKRRNHLGFNYKGKHYTMYEGTQLQRQLETEIRKVKDTQIIAKAEGNKELILESQQKITKLTKDYRELSKQSGLPTYMERMRVSGYKRTKVKGINGHKNITKTSTTNDSITKIPTLYRKIDKTKQIYHSTNNLKEIIDTNYITGNLQVQNKGDKVVNYGYEGVFLKPEALDYRTALYNGDRGNIYSNNDINLTNNLYDFIDKASKEHKYSTAVVEDMPLLENIKKIRIYKESDNYKMLKRFAKDNKIPIEEYELGFKPYIIKKGINHSNR